MASIRLLHLSDFHQGLKGQKVIWPEVKDAFRQDLGRLLQKIGPLDLVVFTGDMTQSGTQEEFEQFERMLQELWSWFKEHGCNPGFLVVPGNHDLVRPKSTSAVVKALTLWNHDSEIRETFWNEPKGEYRQAVEKAFKPFSAWARHRAQNSPLILRPGLLPGDFSVSFEKNGLRLGVVGLNSAFLQLSGRDFEGDLDIDLRQFNAVCGGDPPEWLRQHDVSLLLTHHPASWLSQESQQRFRANIDRPGFFLAHLHGHMHEPVASFSREGGALPRRRLCGVSLFGLEYWERAQSRAGRRVHGYCAIELKVDSGRGALTLWPRSMEFNEQAQYRRIIPDSRRYDLDANEATTEDFQVAERH
ncbi:metallophosphoesterase family protein [Cystobacter fuscus]|uniref:metallophosphoesterase family protein n=1 Tax=Cystobacter fuscus TaxID=43 RepID=UPI002B29C6DB|nr:metallophosphoesterase [Cystobacter fuscus]